MAQFFDQHRVRYDRCPVCGSEDAISPLLEGDWSYRADYDDRLSRTILWMKCQACEHEFTWGYHSEKGQRILFDTGRNSAEGLTGADVEQSRPTWAKVVDAVAQYQPEGLWLDAGAGAGMLLATAQECGYSVSAIEARPRAAEALRALGFEVLVGDLVNDAVNDASVDVLSFCDVLEHLPFPLQGLSFAQRVLRTGGILFISCPNRESVAWTLLTSENANPYYAEIRHHHNFGLRQLRGLLNDYGFEVLSCSVSNRYRLCVDIVARRTNVMRGATARPFKG